MIAVIKTGGKQYIVREGDVLNIEKVNADVGKTVTFDVLLASNEDGSSLDIGTPTVSAKATGEVVEQGRAVKVDVVKFKPKSKYRRRVGHRQPYTKIKIVKLGA